MDNTNPIQEIQDEYKSNQNPTENLTQKIQDHYNNYSKISDVKKDLPYQNSNKFINFILLVLYSLYSLFLLDVALNSTFQNGVSGILLMFLFPIYLAVFLFFASVIFYLLIAMFSSKINIVAFIPMFSATGIIIALSLFGDWNIFPKILGVLIILTVLYKIYSEFSVINNKFSKLNLSDNDDNYFQNNISNQIANTSYSQTSTQSSPQISFNEQENLTSTNNITQPSSNTPLQEIQDEYKSILNTTETLTQKIQAHYNKENTVNNTQEYVVKSNPNKFRNIIFSGFLILGFLAFAFLSLGGILVGDLTVSGVLAVASIILVIDGYLFYRMWFKK